MANKKDKTYFNNKFYDDDSNIELHNFYYFWYDGGYSVDDYDDYDPYLNYEYLECFITPYKSMSVYGIKKNISIINSIGGRLIDMTSIYSKEILREKKINHLLGIDKSFGINPCPNTLSQYFPNNVKNENRNI